MIRPLFLATGWRWALGVAMVVLLAPAAAVVLGLETWRARRADQRCQARARHEGRASWSVFDS